MTPEPLAANAVVEPRGMGEFSRIIGVFLEPSKAFEDIVRHPKWLIPLLLVIAAGIAYMTTFGAHVTWDRYIQHQLDTSPKAQQRLEQMPPEQRAKSLEMQKKFSGVGADITIVVLTFFGALVTAGVALLIANVMSAGVRFKQMFAIVAYANLPLILKHGLAIVVMFLKSPDDFNLQNPLAFNPAAFMDPVNSSKFLYTLASSLDVFYIWIIVLSAVGLKAAAGKRLSFGGALFAFAAPFVLFAFLGASLAGAFA
jgi:Yip1 domain